MSTIKNDQLDAMILLSAHVLAERNEAELMSVNTSDVSIPVSIERRITHMINKERRKSEYGAVYKTAKEVAAVVLIVCSTAFIFAMSVDAVREALWSTIVKWYEDYISVAYVVDDTPPMFIETKKEPTAIPEDWTSEVKVDSQSMYFIKYSLDGEYIMSFRQKILDGDEEFIDNENSTMENIKIHGFDGILVTLLDKGFTYLCWNDGCYSYTIDYDNSKISMELAIDIAESLQ